MLCYDIGHAIRHKENIDFTVWQRRKNAYTPIQDTLWEGDQTGSNHLCIGHKLLRKDPC